ARGRGIVVYRGTREELLAQPRRMRMYQGLKPEQAADVQRAADLSRELFAKRAEQHDRTGKFPLENYADLHKAGLLGLTVPKEYGGVGADWVTFALTMLEIAKGCSATALTFNMHAVILDFIAQLGTEEQKRRWFGEVIDRGKLFSSITSEPQASFRHKFVLSTTFAPVEGGFLLSGVKHFGSLGEHASFHFVTALIEGTTTATEGQQSALVPAGSTGISVDRNWDAVGMRATSSDTIKYDKCFLRREAAQVKMQGDRRETALAINESKCMSADVGFSVTDRAIRLAGGRGILRKYPLERWHRDAMCGPVMAPANDRCLETAGRILCGLEGKTLEFV